MVDIREATQDLIDRYMNRPYAIEICEVMMVYPHREPFENGKGDRDFDVVDVKLRDVRMPPGSAEEIVKHSRALVLQRYIGNLRGNPWVPQIGDLVLVAFAQDEQAVIIGQLNNIYQEPVCRPTSNEKYYDIVYKICQHDSPKTDEEKNYIDHPGPTKPPVCFKYFDETRDVILVHECPYGYGDNDPHCKDCKNIDYVSAGSSRFKFRSSVEGTENCSAEPKSRIRFDHKCASRVIFDTEGYIEIENALDEDHPKGHICFGPNNGNIVIKASRGALGGGEVEVFDPDDPTLSAHIKNAGGSACIKIYKDDKIEIGNGNLAVTLNADGSMSFTSSGAVTITSPTEINLNAPVIKQNEVAIHGNPM